MVLPGHLAGGYLITKAMLFVIDPTLDADQTLAIIIIGTIAGELPDIDIAIHAGSFLFFKKFGSQQQKNKVLGHHRKYITHAPIFWLALCLLVMAVGYTLDSTLVMIGGLTILAGTYSHFILDSIEYGIRWLWPFSDKRYSFIKSQEEDRHINPTSPSYYWNFIRNTYIKRLSFYLEIALTLLAIYVVLVS